MTQMSGSQQRRFLLISVSTAGAPASLRVAAWRKLRSLGAVYLQQSVCLLPASETLTRQVRRLLARIHSDGGTGQLLTITIDDPGEQAQLIRQFNAARDLEYAEVLDRTPAMLAEIEAETARGRATYAEVEESEADLHRFQTWLAKITARDYFDASGRAAAEAAVERWAQALAAFEAAALAADTDRANEPPATARPPVRLTLVEGN